MKRIDSGLTSLKILAAFHQVSIDEGMLKHELAGQLELNEGEEPHFATKSILLACKVLGLKGEVVNQNPLRLDKAPWPGIAQHQDGRYFIVAGYVKKGTDDAPRSSSQLLIQHAGETPALISAEDLLSQWTGKVIFFTSKASFSGAMAKFDFTWFIPAIIKYRKLLTEVLLISFVLQLLALVTPLFFQVIMDKVLVNHAMKTLNVITIGLICAILFEAVLTGIRTYVFSTASSKIDVELGTRLFRHLLALPMAYFHSRRVGDSVARVRELESIRAFLTGNAMTLVLDVVFSFVFLAVMFWYSVELTWIVLASIPLYVMLSLIFTPILREKLNDKFNKSAENQSFLVETLNGIDTVKALAVEPRWQHKWERQIAAYVSAGQSTSNISMVAGGSVTLTSKLVTAAVIWVGAGLVIEGKLTVGQLVAFNMLAGQVSSPILRLAQLWNDFQQVGISMARLADILNVRTEVEGQKTRMPRIQGAIEFDQVFFRYRPDSADVLRSVSLRINPGEVVGVVGRSGSGKSTLAKLAQRLYLPIRGRVLVDGQDIAIVDTASLRHQIGVVLQENMLFNCSVRDNISLSNQGNSIEKIIHASRLAGAHNFICELPEGYDTVVGEHGTGLSGGQRQRIAIARALITNPRILIFDEATSALDYESEKIIQDNMRSICKGRTVIIIAHRLSAVRDADRILVMDRGEIAEMGSHDQLLRNSDGIYSHLYALQHGKH